MLCVCVCVCITSTEYSRSRLRGWCGRLVGPGVAGSLVYWAGAAARPVVSRFGRCRWIDPATGRLHGPAPTGSVRPSAGRRAPEKSRPPNISRNPSAAQTFIGPPPPLFTASQNSLAPPVMESASGGLFSALLRVGCEEQGAWRSLSRSIGLCANSGAFSPFFLHNASVVPPVVFTSRAESASR